MDELNTSWPGGSAARAALGALGVGGRGEASLGDGPAQASAISFGTCEGIRADGRAFVLLDGASATLALQVDAAMPSVLLVGRRVVVLGDDPTTWVVVGAYGTTMLNVPDGLVQLDSAGGVAIDSPTFVVDATNNRVGIGTAAPAYPFEVRALDMRLVSDGSVAFYRALSFSTTASFGGFLDARRGRGTLGTPGGVLAGDFLGGLQARGYNSCGAVNGNVNGRAYFLTTEDHTTGAQGTAFAIDTTFTGSSSTAGTRVYVDGSGNMGVGTTTPASRLDVANTTGGILTLRRVDTSVTANDMVGKLQFYAADTSTTTNPVAAEIEAQATNTVTTDINPGRLIFRTTPTGVAATPTERLRIDEAGDFTIADGGDFILATGTGTKIGTATSQKLAFWNATPIVQPTTAVAAASFVANTSGIADDTATFDGYTIGQVVKALRNVGVLA